MEIKILCTSDVAGGLFADIANTQKVIFKELIIYTNNYKIKVNYFCILRVLLDFNLRVIIYA
jgi:hypothetical protein